MDTILDAIAFEEAEKAAQKVERDKRRKESEKFNDLHVLYL